MQFFSGLANDCRVFGCCRAGSLFLEEQTSFLGHMFPSQMTRRRLWPCPCIMSRLHRDRHDLAPWAHLCGGIWGCLHCWSCLTLQTLPVYWLTFPTKQQRLGLNHVYSRGRKKYKMSITHLHYTINISLNSRKQTQFSSTRSSELHLDPWIKHHNSAFVCVGVFVDSR